MAGIGSTVDLLLFYTLERVLFNRMVGPPMGKSSTLVKKAMALWLMLEEVGYHDLIRMINSFDNKTIESLLEDALRCVECIQLDSQEPEESSEDSSVFIGLFGEPMNLRFFYYNRVFLYKRFAHIMETVCHKIFGENAAMEVEEFSTYPVLVRPFSELGGTGTSPNSISRGGETSTQRSEERRQSNLNPNATEYNPGQTSEDSRTMFLTFSVGHPLSRDEIIQFFTSKWGQVVEEVVIEQTRWGQQPLYARVILTTSLVIPRILNGQSTAKFVVNRKHLRARVYIPRPRTYKAHYIHYVRDK